jgi:hypothetical protein
VTREGKASTSFVQRHLGIGYNRAAKLIEQMEKEGVVGPANHVGKREVLAPALGHRGARPAGPDGGDPHRLRPAAPGALPAPAGLPGDADAADAPWWAGRTAGREAWRLTPAMKHGLLAAGLALAGCVAEAGERPATFPTRDVAVTYRVRPPTGQEVTMRNSWLAAAQRVRTDPADGSWFMVLDRRAGTGFRVQVGRGEVISIPEADVRRLLRVGEGTGFTRVGADRVANTDCTIWRFEAGGQTITACYTADGVVLRSHGSASGPGAEAIAVEYGPQDPSKFERPRPSPPPRPANPWR